MKVNQIIDEMQASLTKLRGHFRSKGTAGECNVNHITRIARQGTKALNMLWPEKGKCTCDPFLPGYNFYRCCPVHKLKEAAGECTCPPISCNVDPCCPKHGLPRVTPDLPLHARVAKAIGKKIMLSEAGWEMLELVNPPEYENHRRWHPIPDYPNDLVAAMGALEEYCQKNKLIWGLRPPAGDAQYWDIIDTRKDGTYTYIGSDVQTAPQAICEAICAHAEKK